MKGPGQFLPAVLEGKPIGVLSTLGPILGPDLKALGCYVVPVNPLSSCTYETVAAFVLDCYPMLQHSYPAQARAALSTFTRVARNRHCYGVFPYGELNYNWDVMNNATPHLGGDLLPGARWIYDSLLGEFAARSVADTEHQKTRCIVTQLLPLQRTLMCIMASSGHGKTTLVRALKARHGIFHTSSDYLLSTLINTVPGPQASAFFLQLKLAIEAIPTGVVWDRFFRLLEENHTLLLCFLEMAWQHMALVSESSLMSFDIDLREESSKNKTIEFFKGKNLKIWECKTS